MNSVDLKGQSEMFFHIAHGNKREKNPVSCFACRGLSVFIFTLNYMKLSYFSKPFYLH